MMSCNWKKTTVIISPLNNKTFSFVGIEVIYKGSKALTLSWHRKQTSLFSSRELAFSNEKSNAPKDNERERTHFSFTMQYFVFTCVS